MPERFFTTKDVAELLKVTEWTVRQLIDKKEITAHKVGNQWRVSDVSLQDYLNKNSNQ